MALTTIGTASIDAEAITEPKLAVTGTGSTSNFLRGDMSWAAPDGDIAGVTAGTGLNGGGTSGTITVNLDTTLPNNTVISTSGAITTTGAFTSVGIDDNADSNAITIDSNENVIIGDTAVSYSGDKVFIKGNAAGADDFRVLVRNVDTTSTANSTLTLSTTSATSGDPRILFNVDGVANVFTLGVDNSDSDMFKISAGNALGTTDRMSIDSSGTMTLYDHELARPMLKDYSETKVAMAANEVDISLGNVQTYTLSGSQSLTFSNPIASGNSSSFTLLVTNGGSATLTWPGSVDWAGGAAPTLTASGVDALVFTTIDGGTTWYGFAAGLDLS